MAAATGHIGRLPAHRTGFHYFVPWLCFLAVLMMLQGCAVRLGPSYDPSIVTALQEANEQAQTLFAGASGGASRATFSQRQPTYNAVIGKLEATRLSAAVRPIPAAPSPLSEIAPTESPSVNSLTTAAATITQMRDTDQQMGLTENLVEGFKRSFDVSMAQALTYEKALQR